jgi:hypothetical protein
MKVLIVKQNEQIIKNILPKVKFTESTKHTSFFNIKEKTFQKLYQEVKFLGYNPYALMNW